jgi:predicted transcriptional regulator
MKKSILILFIILFNNSYSQTKKKTIVKKINPKDVIKKVKVDVVKSEPDREVFGEKELATSDYVVLPTSDESEEVNLVYSAVEIMPEPPGGVNLFKDNFVSKFKRPKIIVTQKTVGTVVGHFVVEKDGSITDIKILIETPKDIGLGSEYLRLMKDSEKWKPGWMNGEKVRVYYTLPIKIDL